MLDRQALLKLLAAGALAYVGWKWQRAGEARDARQNEPPGRMVHVHGQWLHAIDEGVGTPTVVLANGLGGTCMDWELVAPGVSTFARAVRFDRAGLGWSEAGITPSTASRAADEMRSLLKAMGAPPPYVLVGWSSSAFDVRAFALRYPEEVAGMVLVDPPHEAMHEAFGWRARALTSGLKAFYGVMGLAGEFGLARLLGPQYRGFAFRAKRWLQQPTFSRETQRTIDGLYRSRHAVRALLAETLAFERSIAEMKWLSARSSFPNIPLIVVTHGYKSWRPTRNESIWHGLQERLAGLSPQGKLVFAPGAGHLLPLDRPDVIVDAIRVVVAQAQAGMAHRAAVVPGHTSLHMH